MANILNPKSVAVSTVTVSNDCCVYGVDKSVVYEYMEKNKEFKEDMYYSCKKWTVVKL